MCVNLKLYAPVKFETAVEPYVIMIESMTWPCIVIQNTFTLGRLRYRYCVDESTGIVTFTPNVMIDIEVTSKNTICCLPVCNVNPVLKLNIHISDTVASNDGALSWLYSVFGSNVSTLLWALGDMLYDSSNKRMFIMYGPGGVGKSTVANIMNAVVGGTIPSLKSSLVCIDLRSFRSDLLDKDDLVKVASSRIVSVGDVEPMPNTVLHMQNIKIMTGGDEVHGIKVHTTLVMTVNKLFHYNDLNDWIRPDRLRRVVVVPSLESRDGDNVDIPPLYQDSLDELVQFALRVRIRHTRPPMCPDVVLTSLFQDRYKEAMELICIDKSAALHECMSATMMLCWRFNVDVTMVSSCLKWLGCCCAVESSGVYFIANIKPLRGANIAHIFESTETKPGGNRRYYKHSNYKSDMASTPLFS